MGRDAVAPSSQELPALACLCGENVSGLVSDSRLAEGCPCSSPAPLRQLWRLCWPLRAWRYPAAEDRAGQTDAKKLHIPDNPSFSALCQLEPYREHVNVLWPHCRCALSPLVQSS